MFKTSIDVYICKQKLLVVLIFNLILIASLPFVYASTKYSYEDDIEYLFNLRHHQAHSTSLQKSQFNALQKDEVRYCTYICHYY